MNEEEKQLMLEQIRLMEMQIQHILRQINQIRGRLETDLERGTVIGRAPTFFEACQAEDNEICFNHRF